MLETEITLEVRARVRWRICADGPPEVEAVEVEGCAIENREAVARMIAAELAAPMALH